MLGKWPSDRYSGAKFDVIVIGGGITGAMLCLAAAQRGLKPLLIERADFGGGTSYNSLRIVHGGLRYLQTADLARFFRSVHERRWFFENFGNLVEPLPCLLPLYGGILHRPAVLRSALAIADMLSFRRNRGLSPDAFLQPGRIVSPAEVLSIFPNALSRGLLGGAVWYDGFVPNFQRLLIAVLHWACSEGAVALNYMEVQELAGSAHKVTGVHAISHRTGESHTFKADTVINATGPWAHELNDRCNEITTEHPAQVLAWNVLFRRKAVSAYAIALHPPRIPTGAIFFLPWQGALLVGTGYETHTGSPDYATVKPDILDRFIRTLNAAAPGLTLTPNDVIRVFVGLLPSHRSRSDTPTSQDIIIDHGRRGGKSGFVTVSAAKFTTAKALADRTMSELYPSSIRTSKIDSKPPTLPSHPNYEFFDIPDKNDNSWKRALRYSIQNEAVVHLDDLLLRRSCLGDNPDRALALARGTCDLFSWDDTRKEMELQRLLRSYRVEHNGSEKLSAQQI